MFSCHRRSPSQDSPSSSGVVDIDNESSASSGDDAIEQRRRKENKAKDEKKAKTKRRRKNPAQDNEEVASVVDLTAARSKEQAAAACRDTIKRCNLFRRPEASAVRSWAKGKKVLLAVDLQVEQLSSIGTDQSHKHMRKHHAMQSHTLQGFLTRVFSPRSPSPLSRFLKRSSATPTGVAVAVIPSHACPKDSTRRNTFR